MIFIKLNFIKRGCSGAFSTSIYDILLLYILGYIYLLRHYKTLLEMRLWHAILSKTSYGKEDGAEFMVTEEEDIVPVKRKSSSSSSAGRGPGRPKKEREDKGDGGGNVGGAGGNVGGAGGSIIICAS